MNLGILHIYNPIAGEKKSLEHSNFKMDSGADNSCHVQCHHHDQSHHNTYTGWNRLLTALPASANLVTRDRQRKGQRFKCLGNTS